MVDNSHIEYDTEYIGDSMLAEDPIINQVHNMSYFVGDFVLIFFLRYSYADNMHISSICIIILYMTPLYCTRFRRHLQYCALVFYYPSINYIYAGFRPYLTRQAPRRRIPRPVIKEQEGG